MVNVRSRANIGNCELRRMLGSDSTAAEGRLKIQKRKMTEQLQVVESAGQNIDGKIVRQTTNDLPNNRHTGKPSVSSEVCPGVWQSMAVVVLVSAAD